MSAETVANDVTFVTMVPLGDINTALQVTFSLHDAAPASSAGAWGLARELLYAVPGENTLKDGWSIQPDGTLAAIQEDTPEQRVQVISTGPPHSNNMTLHIDGPLSRKAQQAFATWIPSAAVHAWHVHHVPVAAAEDALRRALAARGEPLRAPLPHRARSEPPAGAGAGGTRRRRWRGLLGP